MLRAAHSEKSIPLRKGAWTVEEDQRLTSFIQTYGVWNWNSLPKAAGLLRTGKSCRLRWVNYLRPNIKHGDFSKEEVETIIKLQQDVGNRWSLIASKLPGRTDNDVKNFWNTHLKKQLLKKRHRNNGKQATKSQKQKNISSEENVSSLSDPKAPNLEGLKETQMSPEQHAPVDSSSSASSSFTKPDKTDTIEEKLALQEFPVELKGLPEEPLGLGSKQNLCDGHPGTPQIEPAGHVHASSSSGFFTENNKNRSTEENSDSPGLSEELKSIWEVPILADDFLGKVPRSASV